MRKIKFCDNLGHYIFEVNGTPVSLKQISLYFEDRCATYDTSPKIKYNQIDDNGHERTVATTDYILNLYIDALGNSVEVLLSDLLRKGFVAYDIGDSIS